ncbi:MAG: hypothetical protein IJS61_05695 [Firmicutes bacterium]|nr:hypothetical protein [Bacillota bacterium]
MKKTETFFSIIIAFITVFLALMLVFLPKKDFSENENRVLKAFPSISSKNVFKGSFFEDTDKYLSDHFPFKDNMIASKTLFEKNILLKKDINNIYIAKDGYCIEKYSKPQNLEKIAKTLKKFKESINKDTRLVFMPVPTAVSIYKDKLPRYAYNYDQEETVNYLCENTSIESIKLQDAFTQNKDKELYYRLDHHWTTEGAYIAYKEYMNYMGLKPKDESYFVKKDVTNSFKGTVYSKLGYSNSQDTIKAYFTPFDIKKSLFVEYDGEKSNSLYNDEYLDKKDKYSYFLDNIHSLTVVTNNEAESNEEIAIIKDSYANCFVPLLTPHYKKIYVFDTRNYLGKVSDFLKENSNIKTVLILYNMGTIDTDTGINMIS